MSDSEALVRNTYTLLLDREPEPVAMKHWASALQNGMPKRDFLQAIISSAEFREQYGGAEAFNKYHDVDLILPIQGHQLRVPAADLSLVPHLLEERSWEPHLTHYLACTLRPDDVFMDVGANLGYFTVLFAAQVRRVVAFEPSPLAARYCRANIALNALGNVELFPYGLWHEETTINMRVDPSSLMAASLTQAAETSVVPVRCVALDGLTASGELVLPRLDMIKMDIEGAEVSALRGMRATLARTRPRVIFELNRPTLARLGTGVEDIWDFFRALSYRLSVFTHWQEVAPEPVDSLEELKARCPQDSLVDVLATPSS